MEINEGNKLIAEFMDEEIVVSTTNGLKFVKGFEYPSDLRYHISWDWLMPVVEKIEGLDTKDSFLNPAEIIVSIEKYLCFIATKSERELKPFIQKFLHDNRKIETVWQAVVAFITWYNTTLTPK